MLPTSPLLHNYNDASYDNQAYPDLSTHPRPSRLAQMARIVPPILGSYTVGILAATMVGFGVTQLRNAGLGVGLTCAGTGLWVLSTVSDINPRDCCSIFPALVHSVSKGLVGFFPGVVAAVLPLSFPIRIAIGSVPTVLALSAEIGLPAMKYAWRCVAGQSDSIRVYRPVHERVIARGFSPVRVLHILEPEPIPMTMPSTISGKLREIFGRDRNSITIAHSDDRGQTRNIQFNLKEGEQGGEDFVTFTSIAESDREWIAVARDSSKKLYDFCERSTFFEGDSLKDMNHPLTRALITTDMIFEGSELLTLLTDFSRRRD